MFYIDYPSMADLKEVETTEEAHREILSACKEFLGTEGFRTAQEWIESMASDAWQEEGTKQDLTLALLNTLIESIIRLIPIKHGENEALGAAGVQIRLIMRGLQAAIAYGHTEIFRLSYVMAQYLAGLRIELEEIRKAQETEEPATKEEINEED